MFVLLFRYVFGGSINTGQPGGYVQLLMPGIFVQTVAFTLAGTASGLAEDMKKGLIDRFRSLPISQSALVVGRTLGDSLLNIVVLAVMGIAGYAVGWRPSGGAGNVALGFLFLLLFGYALSWVGALVGLTASDARVVQNVSFIVTFPLTFLQAPGVLCHLHWAGPGTDVTVPWFQRRATCSAFFLTGVWPGTPAMSGPTTSSSSTYP